MTYEELKDCKCLYCGCQINPEKNYYGYYIVYDLKQKKELKFCSNYCFEEYKRIDEYLTKLKGE